MIREYIREDLKAYKPYHTALKPYDIKLDANENPYGHDPKVMEAMKKWLEDCEHIRRYPDMDCSLLKEAIARYWQVSEEQVICGVGSDQLIECIMKVFIEPGDKVLMPTPSFSMYKLSANLNRGISIEFPLNEDYTYPYEEIIRLYREHKPKCVFLCTPNNPTGTVIQPEDMEKLLEVMECPVVIDEAYGEFLGESMIHKLQSRENVIVLRTFSKAYGLAGIRIGYGITPKAMVDALSIVTPPYHLNAFSQYMAKTILEDTSYYDRIIDKLNEQRKWLMEQLEDISYVTKVYPSKANFILIKVDREGIVSRLEGKKILVRGYGTAGPLGNCIRISIGTEEENEVLIETMRKL